jgi:hypothetical protein
MIISKSSWHYRWMVFLSEHGENHLIIDPTRKQFKTKPNYNKAVGCGFLTKKTSKRARELMKKMLWQEK